MITFPASQYLKQLHHAERMGPKIRAAIIMQAWIDGYEVVHEMHDEIVLQPVSSASEKESQ